MGGSKSSDKKTTNITTTTTTKMRDIGLTGKHAVDMAAVLETGAIERTRISASTFDNLIQTVGKTSQQLIGGASNLVRTAESTSRDLVGGASQLVEAQKNLKEDGLIKLAPWIALAAVAVPLIFVRGRR